LLYVVVAGLKEYTAVAVAVHTISPYGDAATRISDAMRVNVSTSHVADVVLRVATINPAEAAIHMRPDGSTSRSDMLVPATASTKYGASATDAVL